MVDNHAHSVVSIHAPTRGATRRQHMRPPLDALFQSTRPRGARRHFQIAVEVAHQFQSTRPRGARHAGAALTHGRLRFNPRAHAGRDGDCEAVGRAQIPVSIHAPTRGATCVAPDDGLIAGVVSIHAPTRGATLARDPVAAGEVAVSIHAPTRGATISITVTLTRFGVSIHAPTRGATGGGHDPQVAAGVSIHAPTRGATGSNGICGGRDAGFNPRAHAGRDCQSAPSPPPWCSFQSTRPRGARLSCPRCRSGRAGSFNPRAHAGRDVVHRDALPVSAGFQSTRPRGARQSITRFSRG